MASEDFLILLSVVFKKFGLVFNEFFSVVGCLFHISIIYLGFTNFFYVYTVMACPKCITIA